MSLQQRHKNKAEAAQKLVSLMNRSCRLQFRSVKGDPVVFAKDEFIKHGVTVESLAKLKACL